MSIAKVCTDRLQKFFLDPETLVKLFDKLTEKAAAEGHHGLAMPFMFLEEGDAIHIGDWVPEITFIVRQFNERELDASLQSSSDQCGNDTDAS